MKFISTCIIFLLFLCSCTENKRYNQLLVEADSIMNLDDDSAKVAIQMLDAAKSDLSEFTTRQKMHYELLYHKAINKLKFPIPLKRAIWRISHIANAT